jgi:hypothetical protein
MSAAEAEIWKRVIGALPGGWFGPECHDLLARYCEIMARARKVARVLSKVGEGTDHRDLAQQQQADLRTANMLAVTLRFAPKARMSNGKAQSVYGGTDIPNRVARDRSPVKPWETADHEIREIDREMN